jgi:hypothetical protein
MHGRISSAHLLALVALTLALGGGAYAASGSLTKTQVKKIADKEIAKRAPGLTVANANHAQTAESAQTAQTAQTAQSAQTATTAERVSSMVKIDQRGNQSTTFTSIANVGGMDLRSRCQGPNANETELDLNLVTAPAATANSSFTVGFGGPGVDPPDRSESATPVVIRGGALSAGQTIAIVPAKTVNSLDALNDGSTAPNTFVQAEGQIVYRSDTSVVTVTFHIFVDHFAASDGYCEVIGTATST